MKNKVNSSLLISTLFGLGYLSKFPGSIASFVTLPIFWVLSKFISHINLVILIVIMTFLSFLIIHLTLKTINDKDPGFIVLDEFIGQSIPIYLYEIAHGTIKNSQESILFYLYIFHHHDDIPK